MLERIRTKKLDLICDLETESSEDLSIVLEGGEGMPCFLTLWNKPKNAEMSYVEISEEAFLLLKKELGDDEQ